jgi:leader peptidase (prepilin peptidase)/N-methyltransferase
MYVVGFIALMGIAYILFCDRSLEGLKYHVFGSLFVGLPVLLLAYLSGERVMGTGDGWLMLAGCLLVGLKGSIIALFVGLLLGSIFGMIHKVRTGDSVFAFGPYLSVGLAVGALWGGQLADLYLSITGLK